MRIHEHCYPFYILFFKIRTHATSQRFVYACMSEFFFLLYIIYEHKAFRIWNMLFQYLYGKKHLERMVSIQCSGKASSYMLIKPKVLRIPMILLSQAYSLHTNVFLDQWIEESYFVVSLNTKVFQKFSSFIKRRFNEM